MVAAKRVNILKRMNIKNAKSHFECSFTPDSAEKEHQSAVILPKYLIIHDKSSTTVSIILFCKIQFKLTWPQKEK